MPNVVNAVPYGVLAIFSNKYTIIFKKRKDNNKNHTNNKNSEIFNKKELKLSLIRDIIMEYV